MKLLTKDQILKVDDMKMEIVEIPEWGGSVNVKMMTAQERDAFDLNVAYIDDEKERAQNFRSRLAVATTCDEKGKLLFKVEEAGELGKKSAKAVSRIFDVSKRLNAIGDAEIEEIEKNLPETPSAD